MYMGVCIKEDFQEIGWEALSGFMWLRTRQVVGYSKHSDESVSFINCTEFLTYLLTYLLHGAESFLRS
jgi:hypothetical protein